MDTRRKSLVRGKNRGTELGRNPVHSRGRREVGEASSVTEQP